MLTSMVVPNWDLGFRNGPNKSLIVHENSFNNVIVDYNNFFKSFYHHNNYFILFFKQKTVKKNILVIIQEKCFNLSQVSKRV